MACSLSPLDFPLHPNFDDLAKCRRGIFRNIHKAATEARRVPIRRRSPSRHQSIPRRAYLTRSSLHRCLQRHGISQLPKVGDEVAAKRRFKAYPIGYFHLDIAEVEVAEGKLYLFVAIDRTSKFAFVELHEKATTQIAADFLIALTKAVPHKIHTVRTDNGTHITDPGGETRTPTEISGCSRKTGRSARTLLNSPAPATTSIIGRRNPNIHGQMGGSSA